MTADEIMSLVHKAIQRGYPLNTNPFLPELKAAIEALQADAARYRWLREEESDPTWLFAPGAYDSRYGTADLGDMLTEGELDKSIDEAMKHA